MRGGRKTSQLHRRTTATEKKKCHGENGGVEGRGGGKKQRVVNPPINRRGGEDLQEREGSWVSRKKEGARWSWPRLQEHHLELFPYYFNMELDGGG